jgi:phage terminase large subunit
VASQTKAALKNVINIELNEKLSEFWGILFNDDGTVNLDTDYDEFAIWGGYGSGKTMTVLLAVYNMCQTYKGLKVTVIRETYTQLDDTIISDFNEMFGEIGYKHRIQQKEMRFANGSTVRFRAFDQPKKILGGNIDVIVISQAEQIPESLFKEIFGRQRGKSTLSKKILITEGNPSECWAKTRYIDTPLPKNIYFLHVSTLDNREFLDKYNPQFIPNLIQNNTEADLAGILHGNWGSHDLMVFSSFVESLNVIDAFLPEAGMRDAIGGDYGWRNPSSFIWGLKDFDGNIIIYDEWYERQKGTDEIAAESLRHGRKPVVYDYSTKRPDRDGKSVWTDLEALGVPLIECNKDELRNISHANRLFKKCQLYITRNCVNLIKEIRNYHWRKLRLGESKNLNETPQDKDNHAIDAMLYLIEFLDDLRSRDPKLETPGVKVERALLSPDINPWRDLG